MAANDVTQAFPQRALEVRLNPGDWVSLLGVGSLLLGFLGLAGFLVAATVPDILRDADVWRHGVIVADGAVAGGECSNWIGILPVSNCHLTAEYRLRPGDPPRQAELEAMLIGGLDQGEAPVVKADPARPERAAVSWFAEHEVERWTTLGALVGALVLLVAVCVGGLRYQLRELALYRALARAPLPVIVTLTGLRYLTSPVYARLWSFEGQLDGQPITGRQRMKAQKGRPGVPIQQWSYEELLVVAGDDGSKTVKVLALADRRGRALLIKASFRPLVLTEDEKAGINRAAQRVN